jgi:hypothetical protein
VDGQMATRFNANEELKVRLSLPFRMNKFSGYTRLSFNQYAYDAFNYNRFDAVFSGYYKNYSANLSTFANWVDKNDPYFTSNLSISYRMRNGLVFRPSAEYNISNKELMRYKAEIEKRVAKAYLSISYERNLAWKTDNVFVSFRYDLPFARTGVSASYNNNMYSFSENAQGSVAFGDKTVKAGYNSALGKGGILVYPFMDLNQNGVFDEGEPMVLLSNVRVAGGQAVISEKDSIVRISDLNSFVDYIVEFSNTDLENISWRFKHKIYQILVDPNQYKKVYVPVVVVGEYSGMTYLNQGNSHKGIGRILVNFYKKDSETVYAKTLSESDGYIYSLDFEPGEYVARIDSAQLSNLNYTVKPKQIAFTINPSIEGDMVMGGNFVLNSNITPEVTQKDSLPLSGVKADDRIDVINIGIDQNDSDIATQNNSLKDSIGIISDNLTNNKAFQALVWGELCEIPGNYYIQCGAFGNESYAKRLALLIQQNTNFKVGIALHNGLYKVRVECVTTKKSANEIESNLTKIVNDDMLIVIKKYLAKP